MSDQVNISEVIQKSTSQVSLDDLNRKGVKRVKVLNQAVITRLIGEAVDRVVSERAHELSSAEREKIIKKSRAQFEKLAKEKLAQEKSREELEAANRELLNQLKTLRAEIENNEDLESKNEELSRKADDLTAKAAELASQVTELSTRREEVNSREEELEGRLRELSERESDLERREKELREVCEELSSASELSEEEARQKDAEIGQLRAQLVDQEKLIARVEGQLAAKNDEIQRLLSQGDSPDASVLKESLEGLRKSISRMAARGVAGGADVGDDVDPETMLKFVDRGDEAMDTNVSKVEVHKKKSSGVASSLAKLKELQKGV